jgi:outer membrane receptor for ferrienterochelin and colicins
LKTTPNGAWHEQRKLQKEKRKDADRDKIFSPVLVIKYQGFACYLLFHCISLRSISESMKRVVIPLVLVLSGLLFSLQIKSQNSELDALLNLGIEDLLNAEFITASKSRQRISEVSANVQIVTAKEMHERGYQSLEDVLADLPGFQFRNISGFNSYVFQRGVPSQNNLILLMIDGVQVNELNSGGFYGGSQYNLSNIEQVEIVYGPASALYGTNAVSGIINLITKKAKENRGPGLALSYGSFSTFITAADYGYFNDKKDYGMRVAARWFSSDKTPLKGDAGDNNWTNDFENFENNISVDLTANYKKMSFGMNLLNKQASRATNFKSSNTEYTDNGTLWNIGFLNGYLQYDYNRKNYALTPKIYYRNSTVLDNTISHILNDTAYRYFRPGNLLGVDLLNRYIPVKNLVLIGGMIAENENVAENFSITRGNVNSPDPPAPPKPEMTNDKLLSFYGQASYNLMKHFDVVAGLRFDISSYYGEVLTPRISFAYRNKNFSSRLLYNEAFRAPRPWDFTSGTGNPDLKPETINSFEWINTIKLTASLYAGLTLYKNYLENIITVRNNGTENWKWVNSGKIETEGIELELKYRRPQFSSWINYTYNFSFDENSQLIAEISKHTANGGFHYYLNSKFNFGMRANFIGKRSNASTSRYEINGISANKYPEIDPAFIVNATAAYAINKHFDCLLYCNNLFDARYYHTSNRPPDRYPQAARAIGIQLRYKMY